jgi:ABC-type phosphonate transport system ATPase subunit
MQTSLQEHGIGRGRPSHRRVVGVYRQISRENCGDQKRCTERQRWAPGREGVSLWRRSQGGKRTAHPVHLVDSSLIQERINHGPAAVPGGPARGDLVVPRALLVDRDAVQVEDENVGNPVEVDISDCSRQLAINVKLLDLIDAAIEIQVRLTAHQNAALKVRKSIRASIKVRVFSDPGDRAEGPISEPGTQRCPEYQEKKSG